jgi:multidrug efflux system outer membrane protein
MNRFKIPARFALSLLTAAVLAGCAMDKPSEKVALDIPAQYRESPASLDGTWKAALPADGVDRGAWWSVFNDSELNGLVGEAARANPTLPAQHRLRADAPGQWQRDRHRVARPAQLCLRG